MVHASDLVKAGLYGNEKAVVDDAVQALLRTRPQLRLELAVSEYRRRDISIGRAATLAGISTEQMKDLLLERGFEPRLGPEDMAEVREEAAALGKENNGDRC